MSARDIAARHERGFFIAAGNALTSCPQPMTLETRMTLALLQELLMALRANDVDGYKSLLALGNEQRGRDVAGEVESEWIVLLLVEDKRYRLVAWEQGVRYEFNYFIGGLHDSL